ncbi:MAG TPA: amidohydrolase [Candidatus Sulfomarinibacteraceae bacterium]|nr:amidohydrolase [Candidatus Sulfomarinibacteraceae bacterium]
MTTNVELLISNAQILRQTPSGHSVEAGAIAIDQGQIVALGPTSELQARVRPQTIWDAGGKLVAPGFVNTHTHLFQTFMKGLGKDRPFLEWLEISVSRFLPHLDEETIYLAAMVGCLEAVRSGATTVLDYMYANTQPHFAEAVICAFQDVGLRAILGRGLCDRPTLPGGRPSSVYEPVADSLAALSALRDAYESEPLLTFALAPSAIWSMTREGLRAVDEYSAAHNLPLTMHLLESDLDNRFCQEQYGLPALPFLQEIGLLGPRLLAVHCVCLNDDDIRLLAENDVSVSHNPVANMILGVGVAPVPRLLQSGVPVALGTDGSASNDNQNFLELLKSACLLHKVHGCDPQALGAESVLRMATEVGAAVVGLQEEVGSIAPGKQADLVVYDLSRPNTTPAHDPVASLVYCAGSSNVEAVLVAGRFLLQDGQFTTIDEQALLCRAAEKARWLMAQVATP